MSSNDNTITIHVERSNDWVQAKRLATGRNITKRVCVEVDPLDLTALSREVILRVNNGEYRSLQDIGFNKQFQLRDPGNHCWGSYGSECIRIDKDSDDITPSDLDDAIANALALIHEKEEELKRSTEERERKEAAEQASKEAARDVLKDELKTLENRAHYAKQRADELQERVAFLEKLLRHVDQMAIDDAIDRIVETQTGDVESEVREELDLEGWTC